MVKMICYEKIPQGNIHIPVIFKIFIMTDSTSLDNILAIIGQSSTDRNIKKKKFTSSNVLLLDIRRKL
jgi:hypothetical protein